MKSTNPKAADKALGFSIYGRSPHGSAPEGVDAVIRENRVGLPLFSALGANRRGCSFSTMRHITHGDFSPLPEADLSAGNSAGPYSTGGAFNFVTGQVWPFFLACATYEFVTVMKTKPGFRNHNFPSRIYA